MISLETISSLLACVLLIGIVLASESNAQEDALMQVYEYQLLNDFLALKGMDELDAEFVSESGFCLRLEEANNEISFLPTDCESSKASNVVSASRIYDGRVIRASLWRR